MFPLVVSLDEYNKPVFTRPHEVGKRQPDNDLLDGPLAASKTIEKLGTARSTITNHYRVPLDTTPGSTIQQTTNGYIECFRPPVCPWIRRLISEDGPTISDFLC